MANHKLANSQLACRYQQSHLWTSSGDHGTNGTALATSYAYLQVDMSHVTAQSAAQIVKQWMMQHEMIDAEAPRTSIH